jgi:hypothetical protein
VHELENLTGKQFRGNRSRNGKRLKDGTRGVGKLWKNRIGGYERCRADADLMRDIHEVPRREKLLSESLAIAESGDCAVRIANSKVERVCLITGFVIPEGEVTVVCHPNDDSESARGQVLVVRYHSDGRVLSSTFMAPRRALRLPGAIDFRDPELRD